MRKSKFTDEQIVGIVREADRDPVPTVAKRHGVSEQSIYTWKKVATTRSPGLNRVTSGPTSITSPEPSDSGITGPFAWVW